MSKRAAIYIRLSRYRGDDDPSNSPETQRRACEEYAKAQGWEVVATYSDLDVSGGSTKRPQLTELRKHWGRFDVALAFKLDRWSRSVIDFHELHREASAQGVALVSVRDRIDMSSANGRLFATILAAFAEFEREVIRERVLANKATQKSLGKWNGGTVPFGFKVVDSKLEVNETEALIIKEVMRRRAANESWIQICRWLMSCTEGRRWDARAVRRMLKSPGLRGTVLTYAEWEQAQVLAEAQERPDWTPRAEHLLSGLLRCGTCGSTMGYVKSGNPIYRCSSKNHCSAPARVYASEIEAAVGEMFMGSYGSIPERRTIMEADEKAEQLASLKLQMEALDASLSGLEVEALIQAAQEKRALQEAIQGLEQRVSAGVRFEATGRTLGDAWRSAGLSERRALLERHIGKLQVARGTSKLTAGRLSRVAEDQTPEEILGLRP